MGVHVVAVYRPKPGKQAELEAEMRTHVATLRELGLATDFTSIVLKASDGTILECFEWASPDAIDEAHAHPAVLEMWDRYAACCEYGTLAQLPNAEALFPEFEYFGAF